ncbi:MAG: metal-dependent hydrolase [Candidatus Lokiarchaeota archaeon]|nr:metal-dependent hydrolase [Candidatus Lokiarchaeota archaeon]
MDIFTHQFMGILVGLFTLKIFSPAAIILLWIMTFLPDFDVFLEPLRRLKKSYFLSHKAASHSYIIGLLFTGIISFLVSIIGNFSFLEVWLAAFIGYSIHVTLDFLTASKVPIFYPITKKEFRFIIDRTINPLLILFSGINIATLIVSFFTKPYYEFFMALAYFYLYSYLIYFGVRILLRIIVQLILPKNSHYLPNFIPFFYFIYENESTIDKVNFTISKSSLFTLRKKKLLTNTIVKNSSNMKLFDRAKELSKDFRFFHKWDYIIPFFQENRDKINTILILCEALSRKNAYYISVVFDKKSNIVISKEEGFGPLKRWGFPRF